LKIQCDFFLCKFHKFKILQFYIDSVSLSWSKITHQANLFSNDTVKKNFWKTWARQPIAIQRLLKTEWSFKKRVIGNRIFKQNAMNATKQRAKMWNNLKANHCHKNLCEKKSKNGAEKVIK
jgi:hypothetical protein